MNKKISTLVNQFYKFAQEISEGDDSVEGFKLPSNVNFDNTADVWSNLNDNKGIKAKYQLALSDYKNKERLYDAKQISRDELKKSYFNFLKAYNEFQDFNKGVKSQYLMDMDGSPIKDSMKIKQIQTALLGKGMNLGPKGADGFWGPASSAALSTFQAQKGLRQTGTLTAETMEALGIDSQANWA